MAAQVGPARPAGTPVASEDGRPFAPDGAADPVLWWPSPPKDGDPVYCEGARVGTFRGRRGEPGGWYVETVPTNDLPPGLAARVRVRLQ
jgi:hypothetical protein